jgi:hypothetical protein
MAEVLQLANKVLPLSLAAKIQVRTYIELLTTADPRNKKQARPGCLQPCVRLQTRGTQDHWYICVVFDRQLQSQQNAVRNCRRCCG